MLAALRNRVFTGCTLLLLFASWPVCAQEHPTPTKPADNHHATLRWEPSPDAKTNKSAKYWIYRAEGNRRPDGSPVCKSDYKKFAIVDISTTTYVDSTVKGNRVYCYYVITVTGKAKKDRSKPTPTVIAVIPPDKTTK